jgi:hypothetical protein
MSNEIANIAKEQKCALEAEGQAVSVKSPFNTQFLNDLKETVPPSARAWNKLAKRWFIDPSYAPLIAQLIKQHYGENVTVPQVQTISQVEQQSLRVEYVGLCKQRDDGSISAFGFCNNDWSVVFPERVLITFFGRQQTEEKRPETFYELLGLKSSANPQDIKSGYRRMARQWHPDVCREADAADRFRRINEAYLLFCDPIKKRKYDAGLAFEESIQRKERLGYIYPDTYFRAPLRSGNITVNAHKNLGRIVVDEILFWEDITDMFGRVMVVSWPKGADMFEVKWSSV